MIPISLSPGNVYSYETRAIARQIKRPALDFESAAMMHVKSTSDSEEESEGAAMAEQTDLKTPKSKEFERAVAFNIFHPKKASDLDSQATVAGGEAAVKFPFKHEDHPQEAVTFGNDDLLMQPSGVDLSLPFEFNTQMSVNE